MIRLTKPSIEADDLQAVSQVLDSGMLVQGPKVADLEAAITEFVGVEQAVAVSNCTAALHLALLGLDARPGDLVLVTAYSWIATANVIELCGAQPVFVDIDPATFNLDPEQLETVLKRLWDVRATRRRVRAILPVHTFGQLADMTAIMAVADRYGIPVVEDAACALGATVAGRQAGTWGRIGCFSFHPRKAITTGEGGMVVTNDQQIAWQIRALRNHGQDPSARPADFVRPGFNYRLTDFQAALGLTQLAKLKRIVASRRAAAGRYDELLAGTTVQPPHVRAGASPVYQSYVTLLPTSAARARDEIIARLKERGIETNIGTVHMPATSYYRRRYGYQDGDFPVTDDVYARSLTLPLFESISLAEQQRVVHHLLDLL